MGFRMRRLATPLVVILVALVLGTAPADAESSTALNRDVSGPFVGTTFFDFFTNGCSFIHQAFDGTYTTAKGGSGCRSRVLPRANTLWRSRMISCIGHR